MSATKQNQSAELTEGVDKTALRIAQEYLKAHPREYLFTIKTTSENVISNKAIAIYARLYENELGVLKEWMESEDREDSSMSLQEYLEATGHNDVLGRLLSSAEGYVCEKAYIKDCDLNDKVQLTPFEAIVVDNDGNKEYTNVTFVPLTDEEFCAILAMHLENKYFTFNKLTYLKPALAIRILKQIDSHTSYWPSSMVSCSFAVFMDEFKNIANSIMDEDKDLLGIFKSEDPEIRKFAEEHKIRKE